jgi:uncharacterized membrane protein
MKLVEDTCHIIKRLMMKLKLILLRALSVKYYWFYNKVGEKSKNLQINGNNSL